MQKPAICNYRTVMERDMDIVFLQAFSTDKGFLNLFLESLPTIGPDNVCVKSVELSKSHSKFGESDIVVVLEHNGRRTAIQVEDKIDAPAMEEQCERYLIRGNFWVDAGCFDDYYVFIACPKKYYENNSEAKEYQYHISYEKCLDYLKTKNDAVSTIWAQEFEQAITKSNRTSEVMINEAANRFFNRYKHYQELHYPELSLCTSSKSNGWWPHYLTLNKKGYIFHKTESGEVKLIIKGAADKLDTVRAIAGWLNQNGKPDITAEPAGKSASFMIKVPEIDVTKPFESYPEPDIIKCFESIRTLTEIADMFAHTVELYE